MSSDEQTAPEATDKIKFTDELAPCVGEVHHDREVPPSLENHDLHVSRITVLAASKWFDDDEIVSQQFLTPFLHIAITEFRKNRKMVLVTAVNRLQMALVQFEDDIRPFVVFSSVFRQPPNRTDFLAENGTPKSTTKIWTRIRPSFGLRVPKGAASHAFYADVLTGGIICKSKRVIAFYCEKYQSVESIACYMNVHEIHAVKEGLIGGIAKILMTRALSDLAYEKSQGLHKERSVGGETDDAPEETATIEEVDAK